MIDQAIRRLGIGGSEVAALVGCDPERDAMSLWIEKKGGMPERPPSDRMLVGQKLERGVIELYAHVTGYEVEYVNQTFQHRAWPFVIYSPDALCRNMRRGVDAKVVSRDQRAKWGEPPYGVPLDKQTQGQWYCMAMDYDAWDFAVYMGDGMPRVYVVERDDEVCRILLARAEEFYQRYLIGDEEPPMGGSALAAAWLQYKYPEHKRPDMREATPAEAALLTDYAYVRAEQKDLQRTRDRMENLITRAIEDREGLYWPDGSFTWRRTKDQTVTDWESMARGLINAYVPDEEKRKTLIGLYTRTKEGYRKIRFTCELTKEEYATNGSRSDADAD